MKRALGPNETRRALARATSEEQLLEAITDAATAYGWRWHHVRRSDRAITQGAPGFPDLIMVRGGSCIALELKAELGRHEPGQREWLAGFARAGCYAMTARPSDLDAILEVLR